MTEQLSLKAPLSGIFAKVATAVGLIGGAAASMHYVGMVDPYGLFNAAAGAITASVAGTVGSMIDNTAVGRAINNLPRTLYKRTQP